MRYMRARCAAPRRPRAHAVQTRLPAIRVDDCKPVKTKGLFFARSIVGALTPRKAFIRICEWAEMRVSR